MDDIKGLEPIQQTSSEMLLVLRELRADRFQRRHQLQERASAVAAWAMTGIVAITGFLITLAHPLDVPEKFLLTLVVCVATGLCLMYLRELADEYRQQVRLLARVEKILGLHDPLPFASDQTVLPVAWWPPKSDGTHFMFPFVAIIIAVSASLLFLWLPRA